MDRSLKTWMIAGAIAAALVIGVVAGSALGIFGGLFGGTRPQTIATASLESMRSQNRLNVFAARYVSVTTSKVSRFGLTSERTLILPGDVRYEVDLSQLREGDVQWDEDSRTLSVRMPDVQVAGPEVDLTKAREYGGGGIVGAITNTQPQLDQANRAAAVADLRKQAAAETPMRLAREAARQAVARSFALPLRAAGFDDVKVVAHFQFEGRRADPSYLDRSRSYEEVMEEARQKRVQGQ